MWRDAGALVIPWLVRKEYDHLTSDEAVDEGIIINEYTFTDAGRRFG